MALYSICVFKLFDDMTLNELRNSFSRCYIGHQTNIVVTVVMLFMKVPQMAVSALSILPTFIAFLCHRNSAKGGAAVGP